MWPGWTVRAARFTVDAAQRQSNGNEPMKLYDSVWAPSPRRVRIYLAEKGITVDRVQVDLRENEQLGDPFLAINPRGTVPALELDDGEVICESAAICRYFEALHPAPSLFGQSALDIARIESWTRRIEADGYASAVYVFRNSKPQLDGRGNPGKWSAIPIIPDLVMRGTIMWSAFIAGLDARLGESTWIAGEDYSFADITGLVANLMNRGRMPQLAAAASGRISAAWLQPQPHDTVARFDYETHLAALSGDDPRWPASTRRRQPSQPRWLPRCHRLATAATISARAAAPTTVSRHSRRRTARNWRASQPPIA